MEPATPEGRARPAGRWIARVMEVLFPGLCRHCEAPLSGAPSPWFCGPCWDALETPPGRVCHRCGVLLPEGVVADVAGWCCGPCVKRPPPFSLARAMGDYDGVPGAAVRELKFGRRTGVARALIGRLRPECYPDALWEVDRVVPVPLHPGRLRERGFNQSGRLAHALGKRLGREVDQEGLKRVGPPVSQVGLSRKAREAAVKGAFVADPERVAGRRILLVDDVITTGATARACARALLKAGARDVTVWAVARRGG